MLPVIVFLKTVYSEIRSLASPTCLLLRLYLNVISKIFMDDHVCLHLYS